MTLNDILTFISANALWIGLGAAALALGLYVFLGARSRHIERLLMKIRGQVPVPQSMKETLARALNADVAEVSAIGVVTFADLAWHYSMADPAIWDHFQGVEPGRMADALQNLDVLKGTLGDKAVPVVDHILHSLAGLEATQLFIDLSHSLGGVADSAAIVLDVPASSFVDTLLGRAASVTSIVQSKLETAVDAGPLAHIPVVTIGFASYRAWRRSQKGAGLKRNLEFAALEVTTRATGGLIGAQMGGLIGTAVAPGAGTIIGSVTGAVTGAVSGALLGEAVKRRHVEKSSSELNKALTRFGDYYLKVPPNFERLKGVFVAQENRYMENLSATRRRLRRSSLPWRTVWPDEKLILLKETVRLAEDRLGGIKLGTIEAIDRLNHLRDSEQGYQLGLILWNNPALCQELLCDGPRLKAVAEANDRLRYELTQHGASAAGAPA